ncbi:DUF7344 domain-containing protein [Haloferax marinum]
MVVVAVTDSLRTRDRVAVSDILGYPPRTLALTILRDWGTPMNLDRLSNRVADGLSGNALGPTASTERKIAIQLHHTHLPLLDDAGVVSYDPNERTVTSIDEARLDELLDLGRQLLESLQREQFRTV